MNIIEKIFTTSGRLDRRHYLMYFVVWSTFTFFAESTHSLLFEFLTGSSQSVLADTTGAVLTLIFLVGMGMIMTRRLHDLGKSGFHLLIVLIPMVGTFFLLYLFFAKGEPNWNQYGDEPSDLQN